MKRLSGLILITVIGLMPTGPAQVEKKAKSIWTDPVLAGREDPDFSIQGEYGSPSVPNAGQPKWGVQVIADGGGAFTAYVLKGGLPGAGFLGKHMGRNEVSGRVEMKGRRQAQGTITFEGGEFTAVIESEVLRLSASGGKIELPRIERKSKTMGATPPPGAVVLFDGSEESLKHWKKGTHEPRRILAAGHHQRRDLREPPTAPGIQDAVQASSPWPGTRKQRDSTCRAATRPRSWTPSVSPER